MKSTGIKVTAEELKQVKTAHACSGMFLSGGIPMGNPEQVVADLVRKYNVPDGAGLNIQDGVFYLP